MQRVSVILPLVRRPCLEADDLFYRAALLCQLDRLTLAALSHLKELPIFYILLPPTGMAPNVKASRRCGWLSELTLESPTAMERTL